MINEPNEPNENELQLALLALLKDYFDLGEVLFFSSGRFKFAKEIVDKLVALPCPRCRRVDAAIAHRDFIHVAELKAEIDK